MSGGLELDVTYAARKPWVPRRAQFLRWARAALGSAAHADVVSVRVVGAARSRSLNLHYRRKDKPTNVLSFPAPPQPAHAAFARPLGDVVLAYDTMLRESAEQSKPLQHHLAHLLVHGILHLLGQDHETGQADAEAMEALEIAALGTLGVPDPYAD